MKNLDIRPKGRKASQSAPRRGAYQLEIKKVSKKPAALAPLGTIPFARPRWRRAVVTAIVGGVALLGLFSFFILPQVIVTAALRSEPTTRDFEIRVDSRLSQVDAAALAVPGKVLEQEVPGSKAFTPTGTRNVGQTASGFIHIYNFSKTTLILK